MRSTMKKERETDNWKTLEEPARQNVGTKRGSEKLIYFLCPEEDSRVPCVFLGHFDLSTSSIMEALQVQIVSYFTRFKTK